MSRPKPDTFRVDNLLIQNAPKLFEARRVAAVQLRLPGIEPDFGIFDQWATLALYALLDPDDPTKPVSVKPTELLEVLQFAREVSSALSGYETFPSEAYRLVEESLYRLFSVEVRMTTYRQEKTGKRGRPRTVRGEYIGRILVSFQYDYPEGVTPPGSLPGKRRNVNPFKTDPNTGKAAPAIWREVEGPGPIAIQYRFNPDLVKGLTGEKPNIGATTFPMRVFALRTIIKHNPTANRLLLWVIRQTSKSLTRTLAGLATELNLEARHKGRNRETLLKAFALLQENGVIESHTVDDTADTVTFTKCDDWHFARVGRPPGGPPKSLKAP